MNPKITLYLLLVSAYHGFIYSCYFVSLLMFLSFLTSIVFHNNLHKNGRLFDIYISRATCLSYLIIYLYNSMYLISIIPLVNYIIGIICYLLGVKYNSNKFHSLLHIFMTFSSMGFHKIKN